MNLFCSALAYMISRLNLSYSLITTEITEFLQRINSMNRLELAVQLILFGYVNLSSDIDQHELKDLAYCGVAYTIPYRQKTRAFMIEPLFAYQIQHHSIWKKFCSLDNPDFIKLLVQAQNQYADKTIEIFGLLCLLQNGNNILANTPFFERHYKIESCLIFHDHNLDNDLKNAGLYRISSQVFRELCTMNGAENESVDNCLDEILSKFACVPFRENRSDAILFAKCIRQDNDNNLPKYIPILVSMNAYRDNFKLSNPIYLKATEKLINDYQVTNVNNMFSQTLNTYPQNNDKKVKKELEFVLNAIQAVAKHGKYVRILFHPWLSSTQENHSLRKIIEKAGDSVVEEYCNGFAATNAQGNLVIQMSKDSPFIYQLKQNKNINDFLESFS